MHKKVLATLLSPPSSRSQRPSSRRFLAVLLVSTLIHGVLMALLVTKKQETTHLELNKRAQRIKIRIVPKDTPHAVNSIITRSHVKPAMIALRPRQKAEANLRARGMDNDRVSPSSKRKTIKIRTYADLFPAPGSEFNEETGRDHASERPARKFLAFDAENDAISFAKKVRQVAKLTEFAKELAANIAVPDALQELQQRGAAHLRFSRKSRANWFVSEASGDPYFRALLYDTLTTLSPYNWGLLKLSESEFDTVRIEFEYQTTSIVDTMAKPVEIRIDGDKIFLTLTQQTEDTKWQMLGTSPDHKPAANLLGIGAVFARPYLHKDPQADIEVERLRLSPAFIHSIGR